MMKWSSRDDKGLVETHRAEILRERERERERDDQISGLYNSGEYSAISVTPTLSWLKNNLA